MDKNTAFYQKTAISSNGNFIDLSKPKVMGILNCTPDSFFEGSRTQNTQEALKKAAEMIAQGADMLDIGGYSTRPGALHISEAEEINRTLPISAAIQKEFPHIPGIDFAGTVLESDNSKFVKGDEVILTGWRVGEIYFGGYSQFAKVNGDYLVKKPKDISSKQAMILGTAGLTALLCSFAIKAREELLLGEKVKDVLVTGASGGVGSIAVMILNKFGYDVTAVTGKAENEEYLRSLGAKNIINKADYYIFNSSDIDIETSFYSKILDFSVDKNKYTLNTQIYKIKMVKKKIKKIFL